MARPAHPNLVIPAKAGIHAETTTGPDPMQRAGKTTTVIPAQAGIQGTKPLSLDSGSSLRCVRNDDNAGAEQTTSIASLAGYSAFLSKLYVSFRKQHVTPTAVIPAETGIQCVAAAPLGITLE